MNSLQFISSLLAMQSRSAHEEAGAQLKLAANRVAAVAQVHRNFYSDEADEVSCITFLRRLCADLGQILDKTVEAHGDEDKVSTTLIQPIGLLVNELVTNAAKHGTGTIEVAYRKEDGVHELSVCDEGDGLPPDFDPQTSVSGLGMRVIKSLVGQLNGTMTACSNPVGRGSCFTVSFSGQR
jgi:two-component sensor histidine kinase